MKKVMIFATFAALLLAVIAGCKKESGEDGYKVQAVNVTLVYPKGVDAVADVNVVLTNSTTNGEFSSKTNEKGIATIEVPYGVYNIAASEKRAIDGSLFLFNGSASNVTVEESAEAVNVEITLAESKTSQIIIKELYVGGCPKGGGATGAFALDKYMILYNNSTVEAKLSDVCIAMVYPFPATNTTNYDYVDGVLSYEAAGTCPAGQAFWSFSESNLVLAPGKQVVVAFNGAIDNTTTYSQSVDLSKAEYYVTYDAAVTSMATIHPAPAETIPANHYLKVFNYGPGSTWAVNAKSPAMFIFTPQDGQTAQSFLDDANNLNYYQNKTSNLTNARKMVPSSWVLDAIEVFQNGSTKNRKRLPAVVDLGGVNHISGLGYSLYRNVDEEATLAIEGNEAKLVKNYALGTSDVEGGSTDATGIDAEASLKAGALIIYRDSNDSSKDFHLRKQASLK